MYHYRTCEKNFYNIQNIDGGECIAAVSQYNHILDIRASHYNGMRLLDFDKKYQLRYGKKM